MSKKIYIAGSSASFENLYSNEMDGTDEYTDRATVANLQFGGNDNFAIGAWVKFDNVTTKTGYILNHGTTAVDRGFQLYHVNRRVHFFMPNSTSARFQEARSNTDVLTVNTWYYILYVRQGNNVTNHALYINGSAVTLQVLTNTYLSTDVSPYTNLSVGRRLRTATSNYFDGKLYHPHILNIAPDATQATALHVAKGTDLRNLSFGANVLFACKYLTGVGDYPTWTDYISGNNLTMTNQEAADINTDVP